MSCCSKPADPSPPSPSPSGPPTPTPTPTPSPGPPTPCITCTITSQTVATQPANRARTKLGVGEEVAVTFSLGSATWTKSGGGTLSATSGATVTYTAPDTGGSVTLTATGSGCTASITFTFVAPSAVNMRIYPGTGTLHTQNRPDIGMKTAIYFGPDDVSFYNIQYHEVDIACVANGVYAPFNGLGHDAHPATLSASTDVVSGSGTRMNARDTVFSGDPATAAPFAAGTETYDIPYEYKVGGGSFHRFATVRQQAALAADGTLTATKGGASATKRVSDASSSY